MVSGRRTSRSIAEGFAIETRAGALFTVKGVVHPPDRVVAYLRYMPSEDGERERNGRRYRRVYGLAELERIVQDRWPEYLFDDPATGAKLQAVPWADVRTVYDPRARLQSLATHGPSDELEELGLAFAQLLAAAAPVSFSALGLTGSVLVGLQTVQSDLDLVVYGAQAGRAVRPCLERLLDRRSTPLRRLRRDELVALHEKHCSDTPLSLEDFLRLQARKVNEGCFRERPYFVRFVKWPWAMRERYGNPRYEPLGPATIRARVVSDADALFTPCRYVVGDVTSADRPLGDHLREIVSFRGRFAEQAKRGEWVQARGTLERVLWANGRTSIRLTVGGRPGDYLRSFPR